MIFKSSGERERNGAVSLIATLAAENLPDNGPTNPRMARRKTSSPCSIPLVPSCRTVGTHVSLASVSGLTFCMARHAIVDGPVLDVNGNAGLVLQAFKFGRPV